MQQFRSTYFSKIDPVSLMMKKYNLNRTYKQSIQAYVIDIETEPNLT